MKNSDNPELVDKRKGKPEWLKIGCGCLIVAVVGFIVPIAIACFCCTPEECEQWAVERARTR